MAKIREALRQVDTRRGELDRTPTPRAYQPCKGDSELEGNEDEIPYIEVGGKEAAMEASPSVLACGKTVAKPLAIEKEQAESQARRILASHRLVPDAEIITGVAFTPFPIDASSLRPVAERFAQGLVAFHKPGDAISQQYRSVASCIGTQLPAGQSQVVLFTTSDPRLDSTTVLLNLAIIRAGQSAARIVVVDANVHRAAIAERLGLPQAPGLCEVLGGVQSLQNTLQETGQPNLKALTAGRVPHEIDGLLAAEAMRAVLRHLRGKYDWVLIDAPCWAGRPEVVALGSSCDAVYLLLPKDQATSPESEHLREIIPLQGGRLRGSILVQQ